MSCTRVPRGEDDDRDRAALGAQLAQHLESVHSGQTDVEDHQIEPAGHRVVVGRRSVLDDGHGEPVGGQTFLDKRRDPRLVLGDQDAGHGSSKPAGIMTVNLAAPGREQHTQQDHLTQAYTATIQSGDVRPVRPR